MSAGRVADGDIDSGLGRAVKDALFGCKLSHAFSCHREPVGIVHEAVENGVGERGVADDRAGPGRLHRIPLGLSGLLPGLVLCDIRAVGAT